MTNKLTRQHLCLVCVCRAAGLEGDADTLLAWRGEEAELLWAQGQRGMAIRLARALLQRALQSEPQGQPRGQAATARAQQLTALQSTLGGWLAANRCSIGPAPHGVPFSLQLPSATYRAAGKFPR